MEACPPRLGRGTPLHGHGGLPAAVASPRTTPPPTPGILCSRWELHLLAPMAQIQSRWAPAIGLGSRLH